MEHAQQHLVLATVDEQARPLSIRVLGAYAESLGVRTTLWVLLRKLAAYDDPVRFTESEIRQLSRFLAREKVTHLGFYLMTASLKPYRLLVRALREGGFRGVILAGGVHATLCPEESLVEGADFAVQGAGEVPLERILQGADPASIPGLVWRENNAVRVNPVTPAQKLDLDALPFPLFRFDRDRILVDGRLRRLNWTLHSRYANWDGRFYDLVTSRGCVYRCAYCCNVYGAPVRRASVDRVIREVRHVKETAPGIRGVNVQDDSFYAGSEDWVREFCARWKQEVGLPFIVRMIPRYVTPERLELLKSAGLRYVTMGLEGSTRVNRDVYDRKEDCRSFLKAARTVLDANLVLSIDYIIHNPFEREEDLREVAQTLNALPRPNWWIVALSLTPFPHTPLYARCARDKMLDRFATDAYDAMLTPSRPGGYATPRFWLDLITVVLPMIPPEAGAKLIEAGPRNPKAVQWVQRISRSIRWTKKTTAWLRSNTPTLYGITHRVLRGLAGKRHASAAMEMKNE